MSLLSCENLSVGYGSKVVVEDLNLHIEPGQVVCLLGPNGSGKSTILRTLARLQPALQGELQFQGRPISSYKRAELARQMSLVLTDQPRLPFMRVEELLAIARSPYTDLLGRMRKSDRAAIQRAMQETGISHLQGRFLDELSDGERQKVFIARALVQEPQLIILDEPTSHLDIKHMVEVLRILQSIAREKQISCLLSLHDIGLAFKTCEYLLILKEGRVAARGCPEDLMAGGLIEEFYGLEGAHYTESLGLLEFTGPQSNQVFVWGGGERAIEIYRSLSRQGWGLSTGIVSPGQTDYLIAKSLCFELVTRPALKLPGSSEVQAALKLAREAGQVVDSGYPAFAAASVTPAGPLPQTPLAISGEAAATATSKASADSTHAPVASSDPLYQASYQVSVDFLQGCLQQGLPLYSLRSPQELAALISPQLLCQAAGQIHFVAKPSGLHSALLAAPQTTCSVSRKTSDR